MFRRKIDSEMLSHFGGGRTAFFAMNFNVASHVLGHMVGHCPPENKGRYYVIMSSL